MIGFAVICLGAFFALSLAIAIDSLEASRQAPKDEARTGLFMVAVAVAFYCVASSLFLVGVSIARWMR